MGEQAAAVPYHALTSLLHYHKAPLAVSAAFPTKLLTAANELEEAARSSKPAGHINDRNRSSYQGSSQLPPINLLMEEQHCHKSFLNKMLDFQLFSLCGTLDK